MVLADVNSLGPRQNRRHFEDGIVKCIFLNENEWLSLRISLKFVPKVRINNIPSLFQIMAWRRPGDKPLSGPMMVNLLTHICVTQPQWVNRRSLLSAVDQGNIDMFPICLIFFYHITLPMSMNSLSFSTYWSHQLMRSNLYRYPVLGLWAIFNNTITAWWAEHNAMLFISSTWTPPYCIDVVSTLPYSIKPMTTITQLYAIFYSINENGLHHFVHISLVNPSASQCHCRYTPQEKKGDQLPGLVLTHWGRITMYASV